MPLEYRVVFEILNATDADMLTDLEWIKDNHGAKMRDSDADGETKVIMGTLIEASFDDSVATILAFKTQFTTKLGDKWRVQTHYVAA